MPNEKDLTYDVIVLDPPSFARNKKTNVLCGQGLSQVDFPESWDFKSGEGLSLPVLMLPMFPARNLQNKLIKALQEEVTKFLNKYGLPADFAYNKKDESSNYLKVISMKVSKWN